MMSIYQGRLRAGCLVCCLAAPVLSAQAQTAVYQRGYDANVSGALLSETRLTTSNVAQASFGRLFSLPVDGRIYAQPLYVPGLNVAGKGVHNVLFVATMTNKLYAFDADAAGAPLWSLDFSARFPGTVPVPIADYVATDSLNIAGPVGIEGTPVIDPSSNTLYLVTNTRELGAPVFRLHAIDITSGAEKATSAPIAGSVTVGGKTLTFNPALQNQRPALVLSHGQVVLAFGSHEDDYAYYGWVMSYDATALTQTGILNTAPTDDHGGGVWQSGRPPVVDANGYVYLFVGNAWAPSGSSSAWDGVNNFSESVLKLDPTQGLKIVDYFTPASYQTLDNDDSDLTSSGPTLVPGTNVLVGGGKSGILYLLNTQNLGQMQTGDVGALQAPAVSAGEIRGGPVAWTRSGAAGGTLLFNWGANDNLKAFAFSGTSIKTTPQAQSSGVSTLYPGGELVLSANGDNQGIVWAAINGQGDADHRVPPGELHAFNAANVSQQLWSSTANAARDDLGLLAKWVPPMVANGKVYMATSSGQVLVYGLLPTSGNLMTVWPPHQPVLGGSAAFIVNTMAATSGASVPASYIVGGLPSGATAGFGTDSMGRTVMTITTASTTPRGSYRLQVTATAGSSQVTQAVLLDVPDNSAATAARASADSAQSGNPASNAIDNNTASFWHTQYTGSVPAYPHWITLDLGSTQLVSGLSYLPRQDKCVNGTVLQYEVHLSTDNVNWVEETTGGSFDYGPAWRSYTCSGGKASPQRQSIAFPPTSARYVRLTALGALVDGQPWASAAEVKAYVAKGAVPLSGNYVLTARHSGQVMSVSGGSTVAAASVVQLGYTSATSQQWSFSASSNGWYRLASLNSGLSLTVNGGSTAAGAALVQAGWSSANWQQFSLTPYGDGRGFFTIGNRNASGTCLDVFGASTASGTGVIQWTCNSGTNQEWMPSPVSTSAP